MAINSDDTIISNRSIILDTSTSIGTGWFSSTSSDTYITHTNETELKEIKRQMKIYNLLLSDVEDENKKLKKEIDDIKKMILDK